mgnify:FL=1
MLPGHAWEQLNELKLYADAHITDALPRRGRFEILTDIIHRCQQLTGLLAGTMTHDHGYDFIRIGRNLERADMSTRVVELGALSLQGADDSSGLDVHVWTSMLKALNAYQMYRKDVQIGVHCSDVVSFLLQNDYYPRSVAHCLDQVEECLGDLPLHRDTLAPLREVRRRVNRLKPGKLNANSLHAEVDRLQVGFSDIHKKIRETWFD